jgi:hypothetical protein
MRVERMRRIGANRYRRRKQPSNSINIAVSRACADHGSNSAKPTANHSSGAECIGHPTDDSAHLSMAGHVTCWFGNSPGTIFRRYKRFLA